MKSTTSTTLLPDVKVQELPTLADRIIEWILTNGLTILILIIIATIVYKFISLFIHRVTSIISQNKFLTAEQAKQRAQTLASVLDALAKFTIFFITIIMIFQATGLVDVTAIIASAGIVGVAIGLGAQSLVKDVISGFFILFENQFSVGDVVQIGTSKGTVESLGLRITQLRDFEGNLHSIPNSEIKIVINESRGWSRSIVDVGIPSSENAERVIELINSEVSNICHLDAWQNLIFEPPHVTGIEAFKENSMIIRIVAMVKSGLQDKMAREIRAVVQETLSKNGIEILNK